MFYLVPSSDGKTNTNRPECQRLVILVKINSPCLLLTGHRTQLGPKQNGKGLPPHPPHPVSTQTHPGGPSHSTFMLARAPNPHAALAAHNASTLHSPPCSRFSKPLPTATEINPRLPSPPPLHTVSQPDWKSFRRKRILTEQLLHSSHCHSTLQVLYHRSLQLLDITVL